jgi:hypothetical protein
MIGCKDVEERARDLARGVGLEGAIADHLAGCLRCRRRLAEERALDARLGALARADASAEAPPQVQAALLEALRRGAAPSRWRLLRLPGLGGPRWLWPLAGAAAAVALAVVVTAVRPAPTPAERPLEASAPPAPSGYEGAFLPIGGPERLGDFQNAAVVRMRVPAALPVLFGWPLPPADERPRSADVLFGEDGVARGIRFLPTSFGAAQ